MALCLQTGRGAPQNLNTAAEWLLLAAKQNHAKAQTMLGIVYFKGEGVKQDAVEALKWFLIAYGNGDDAADAWVTKIHDTLTSDQISDVYQRTSDFYTGGSGGAAGSAGAGTAAPPAGTSAGSGAWGAAAERAMAGSGAAKSKWREGMPMTEVHALAMQGDAEAQFQLGVAQAKGRGMPQNMNEGMKWLLKAAEQGHAQAQNDLGECHHIQKNLPEAYRWHRRAAEGGSLPGRFNVGMDLFFGDGVAVDNVESYFWLALSDPHRTEDSHKVYALLLRKMTAAEVAAAQRKIADFKKAHGEPAAAGSPAPWMKPVSANSAGAAAAATSSTAASTPAAAATSSKWKPGMPMAEQRALAEQGDAEAQYQMGGCYEDGRGVAKNLAEAVKWYTLAAEARYAPAQDALGTCHLHGRGLPQNAVAGVSWYLAAAKQGHAPGQYNLAVCYGAGMGAAKDLAAALQWYRQAADQGLAMAQSNLGTCYEFGEGTPKNLAEAAKWYRKAAEQGDATGQQNLGNCYESGHGVAVDLVEAMKWYLLSSAHGTRATEPGQPSAADWARELAPKLTPGQKAEAERRAQEFGR